MRVLDTLVLASVLVLARIPGTPASAGPESSEPVDRSPVGADRPLPADYVPDDLVPIPTPPATREGLRLRAPALASLLEMVQAAEEDGLTLRVVSGYRSFGYQKRLYERARTRHGPDQRWVAAPGESEHQLGTAVDLADGALRHVLDPSFATCAEGRWVEAHAVAFGFVITYTEESAAASGILPEPWHVRYLGAEDESGEDR